jgi:predicted membrane channel-forming protein YqfA (hemolysin III family)
MNRARDVLEVPHRLPSWVTWLAFFTGLTGSLSLRLILVAKQYQPELVRLFWYIGVVGNMIFFLFRSYISHRRRRLIAALSLQEKLKEHRPLTEQDYQAIYYLISSLYISKERWNYAVIFFFSMLAIVWDVVTN